MFEDVVRFWAQWSPDKEAIVYRDRRITWSQLDATTDALASGFARLGVGKGDRVGLLMGNCIEFAQTAIAAWKLGASAVLVNLRFCAHEVKFVVEDSDCRIVVSEASLTSALEDIETRQPIVLKEDFNQVMARDETFDRVINEPGDVATICYTSGTTGMPKGAMLTHRSWQSMAESYSLALNFNSNERILLPFAMAFTGGFCVFHWAYHNGATVVLESKYDPVTAIDLIERERITWFSGVPTVIKGVVEHPHFREADVSSWTKGLMGGSVVPVELIEECQRLGLVMSQSYCLTESTGLGTLLSFNDAVRKIGSAGRPLMGHQLRIRTPQGEPCKAGEVGEIQLKGDAVMAGYWNNPAATQETLVDGGWLRTGDMGYVDDDGYLYFVDRLKDMIVSGGLNVYPAEIERVLLGLPGVREAAVVGIPDPTWQETPVAVLVLEPGCSVSPEQVNEACSCELARYKHPHYLAIRESPLPRNMGGKVLKRELQREFVDNGAPLVALKR